MKEKTHVIIHREMCASSVIDYLFPNHFPAVLLSSWIRFIFRFWADQSKCNYFVVKSFCHKSTMKRQIITTEQSVKIRTLRSGLQIQSRSCTTSVHPIQLPNYPAT